LELQTGAERQPHSRGQKLDLSKGSLRQETLKRSIKSVMSWRNSSFQYGGFRSSLHVCKANFSCRIV